MILEYEDGFVVSLYVMASLHFMGMLWGGLLHFMDM